jgi:hypothetical protein
MVLGLVGPLAILYHANFRLGSLNANIALLCMILVSASGIVGRVIYVRIHEGLNGRRKTLLDLRDTLDAARSPLVGDRHGSAALDELARFERTVLDDTAKGSRGWSTVLLLPWHWRSAQRRAFRLLRAGGQRRPKSANKAARRAIRGYVKAVRSVAVFSLYERMFALWHVAHLPLCFLLYASAAVHVVAVHMY